MLLDKLAFDPKWEPTDTVHGSQDQALEQGMPCGSGLQSLPSAEDKGANRLDAAQPAACQLLAFLQRLSSWCDMLSSVS